MGGGGHDLDLSLSVHDASRLEWVVEAALPARDTPLEITLAAEIPANAWTAHDPFERLQLLPRLSGGAEPADPGPPRTIDGVRRAALDAAQRLKHVRKELAREVAATGRGAAREDALALVESALRELSSARAAIARGPPDEPAALARERGLAAEFLSYQVLELLSGAQAIADDALEGPPAAEPAARALRRGLAEALARELAFRDEHGYMRPDRGDPRRLERYVERSSLLKKHFQELFFLTAEHELVALRVRNWSGIAAAMVAAMWAFPLGLLLTGGNVASFSAGFLWIVLLFAVMYAVKDRIKEAFRLWLTTRVARGLGGRVTTLSTAARTGAAARVLRIREWFHTTPEHRPDQLNPEAGATRPVVVLRYETRGTLLAAREVEATHVRLVFRLDLTPLFSRLDDPVRRVPVLEGEEMRFVRAPRAYRIPVELRARAGGTSIRRARILVAHKLGLDRLDLEAPAAAPADGETRPTPTPTPAVPRPVRS